ncbi:hypothetical protein G9A89_013051 [Geosiphon pyriformis]|nr:hypothetical protein G9A89_013051 [Geosiphon pyriformis]
MSRQAWGLGEEGMNILVVVANIQMRALKTEVGKGKFRLKVRRFYVALSKGKQVNIPAPRYGLFYAVMQMNLDMSAGAPERLGYWVGHSETLLSHLVRPRRFVKIQGKVLFSYLVILITAAGLQGLGTLGLGSRGVERVTAVFCFTAIGGSGWHHAFVHLGWNSSCCVACVVSLRRDDYCDVVGCFLSPVALNVKVKKFNQVRVNSGSNYDSLKINEIPTVFIYYLAKPQPREWAWQNQWGKKTLLSLTLDKWECLICKVGPRQ